LLADKNEKRLITGSSSATGWILAVPELLLVDTLLPEAEPEPEPPPQDSSPNKTDNRINLFSKSPTSKGH
jgi:hypothetical protein